MPPFPWEALHGVDIEPDLRVHWLLAVPISESERRFLLDRGFDELESAFAAREVEYFDLGRDTVVWKLMGQRQRKSNSTSRPSWQAKRYS